MFLSSLYRTCFFYPLYSAAALDMGNVIPRLGLIVSKGLHLLLRVLPALRRG